MSDSLVVSLFVVVLFLLVLLGMQSASIGSLERDLDDKDEYVESLAGFIIARNAQIDSLKRGEGLPVCDASYLVDELVLSEKDVLFLRGQLGTCQEERYFWLEEYGFLRDSMMQKYDMTTFPQVIDGLYFNKTIHVQVTADVARNIEVFCHEGYHYLIEEDIVDFCGDVR